MFPWLNAALGRIAADLRTMTGQDTWQPTMTYEDFREALRETPRTWRLVGPGGSIPGSIRDEDNDCPLSKTCRRRTGWLYRLDAWDDAARDMGLPNDVAERVMAAADNSVGHDPEVRRHLLLDTGIVRLNTGLGQKMPPSPSRDAMDEALAVLLTVGSQVLPDDDQERSHPARPIPDPPELIQV